MAQQVQHLYEFGQFRLDLAKRLLWRDGEMVQLTPKCFDILFALIESSGEVVSKDEMMRQVWPDSFVEEGNLTYNISVLRKALGERAGQHQFIVTIPGKGYRFVAEVREVWEKSDEVAVEKPITLMSTRRATKSKIILAVVFLIVSSILTYSFITRRHQATESSSTPIVKSIAVLPFQPLGEQNRNEILEEGLADSLIIKLSKIKQLTVRPTSAVLKYVGSEQDAVTIGRALQVDAVLESRFQQAGDRLRINSQLVRVEDGKVIWSFQCTDLCVDILTLQESVSESLARELRFNLTSEEQKLLTKRYTDNVEAYQLYSKGRYHLFRRSLPDARKAAEYYRQAIALDPNYALAYAGLSYAYASLHYLGAVPAKEAMPKAKEAAEQALRLDGQLAEAYITLGDVKCFYEWDWAGAEADFRRALSLNPNSVDSRDGLSAFLVFAGRFDESIAEIKSALEIDPTSLYLNRNYGVCLYKSRRYDEAIEQLQKTLDMDPTFFTTYRWIAQSYEAKGEYDKAIEWDLKWRIVVRNLNEATMSGQSPPDNIAALRKAYDMSGWRGYWQKALEIRVQAKGRPGWPTEIALLYARIGEKDKAFAWLERGYEERDQRMVYLKVDPEWDSLRSDPRFADLLRRVGLAL